MPNPTTTYSWQLPIEGEDPWFTRFYSAWGQMDATVHSVRQLAVQRTRQTVVISAYASTTTTLRGIALNAPNSWVTVSYGPFGALDGVFTVTASSRVRFELRVCVARPPTGGAFSNFRVVLNGSNVTSYQLSTDSAYLLSGADGFGTPQLWSSVHSLGAGTYTARVQALPLGAGNLLVTSMDCVVLTARECAP